MLSHLPFPVLLGWTLLRERDLTEGRKDDLQCEILPEEIVENKNRVFFFYEGLRSFQ